MKPRISLRQWSIYRPPQFYCTDGRAEGWGDTIPLAFHNWQRCRDELLERSAKPKRKWR